MVKEYHETVLEGGEEVIIKDEIVVDDVETGPKKARDKRSGLVDRKRGVRQLLCYICCAEFGTNSLQIHQKTCLKKHMWGLDIVEHEDGVSKKKAALNRKKCTEPGTGPTMPIPTVKSDAALYEDYNTEALRIFYEHADHCLWCRERNAEAIANAQHATDQANQKTASRGSEAAASPSPDDDALKRAAEEEEARRRAAEEEAHHRAEEEALQRALAEEEAHRKAEEEEEAHQRAEEEARRRHEAELADAARRREEVARARAEEEARRHAQEEEDHRRAIEAEADAARKKALEDARREAEEARKREAAAATSVESEDERMMRLIREEEAARRAAAEEAKMQKRRIAMGQHKFLHKHEGVLAHSQSIEVYNEQQAAEAAKQDIAHMSLSHAKKEGLLHQPRHVFADTGFMEKGGVSFVEVEVGPDGEPVTPVS